MSTKTVTYNGNILGLLGVAFVVLKLTGYIDWSWWWVTLPFWGGLALFGGILALVFLGAALSVLFGSKGK